MFISTFFNVLRAGVTFATGIVLARGLSPAGYGDLMFLLGSFISINMLLDMGSSNAFKTFVSKAEQSVHFFLYYFAWLLFQFLIAFLFVWLICPDEWFQAIWLGHEQGIVFLALLSVFMQQKVWQMVGQIGEASRQTGRVQLLNIAVAICYLGIVVFLGYAENLTLEYIFIGLSLQYAAAIVVAYFYLRKEHVLSEHNTSLHTVLDNYWVYCRPLIFLAFVSFMYDFADKWLLQKYGGSEQQGYFQIAAQFAAVALLATTSVLNVFWKEIAEAWEQKNYSKAENIYRKVSRSLFLISSVVAGFLLPWSEQITVIILGDQYADAWPVLAIMFLYPIYQSLGQVGGAMLLATGHTKKFMYVSSFSMFCAIPATYYVLVPSEGFFISGLGMGAQGLALKIVMLSLITVNLQSWVVAKCTGWKFDWKFQVVTVPLMLVLGVGSKFIVGLFMNVDAFRLLDVAIPVFLVGLIYTSLVVFAIWWLPWLIAMSRQEIISVVSSLKARN